MMNRTLAQKARKQLLRRGRAILRAPGGGTDSASMAELAEIHAALERVERGSYGRCDKCYKGIELDLIEATPQTRYCDSCGSVERAAEAPPAA